MQETQPKKLSINNWAEDDRPREKLLLKGRLTLSDSELLAILIGSGSRNESAVDLCKKILDSVNNDLSKLSKLTAHDLMKFKGIGEAKAITIIAALELGRRRKETESVELIKITSSNTAYQNLRFAFEDLVHEEFWALFLNRANKIIAIEKLSMGGVSGTVVETKTLFKKGIELMACGLIIAHNHPSGNLQPSQQDKEITQKIKETGKLMDITLLDHLIITDNGYFSFADTGIL
ncbi:MAG: DNA repair protein RadC [Bacteroidia bacterium]|nr:DNA repair protein RadC [Bacteroidia bacterium]